MPYNHNPEMYDTFNPEDPSEGRGVVLWLMGTIAAIAVLLLWLF